MNQSVDMSERRLFLSFRTIDIIHASELIVLLLCTWEVMGQISVFVPVFSPFLQITNVSVHSHLIMLVSIVTLELALVRDITPGFPWSLAAWFLWFILSVQWCMKIMVVSHMMGTGLVFQ
jgi:hypothetical protein